MLGHAASKAAVLQLMTDAPVIHLATHGFVGEEFPKGVILFAPDNSVHAQQNEEDCCNAHSECCERRNSCTINCVSGILSAEELAQKKLRAARLMVMSACQTGQGEVTGEGVLGLSRASIQAGVPCSVLSLWPVDDSATAELMEVFYDALLSGMSVARALRVAMLRLVGNPTWTNPRFWSPFFSSGCGLVQLVGK